MNWFNRKNDRLLLPPTPGNWYVDKTGVLFKVKALIYSSGQLRQALVDYPRDNSSWLINIDNWNELIFDVSDTKSEKNREFSEH